jgi:hypothetical protein
MSITDLIAKKRFAPGPGVTGPPPENGIRRFWFLFTTHFWKLIELNLLFFLFSIPILTIPAAYCGMNRVLIKLVREGNCFLWHEFIKEFKANFAKSLPFGLLAAFLLFDCYYAFSWSMSAGGTGMDIVLIIIGFLLLGIAILFSGYVFVLLPALDLKNRVIAKNAFILMWTEWKINLVILGCTIAMLSVIVAFFPVSVILLPVIWFSLLQLIVCTAVNEPLQARIIGPFEQRQKEGL